MALKVSILHFSTSFGCRGSKGQVFYPSRIDSSILSVKKIERNTAQGPQPDLPLFAKLQLSREQSSLQVVPEAGISRALAAARLEVPMSQDPPSSPLHSPFFVLVGAYPVCSLLRVQKRHGGEPAVRLPKEADGLVDFRCHNDLSMSPRLTENSFRAENVPPWDLLGLSQ